MKTARKSDPARPLDRAALVALLVLSCACACTLPSAQTAVRTPGPTTVARTNVILKQDQQASADRGAQSANFSLEHPPTIRSLADGTAVAPTPGEFGEQLKTFGEGWFYGPGIGKTITNVGTIVVFPPYAVYLLGNAGLQLAGYDPLHVTDALPEPTRKYVVGTYEGVVSVPGRITSVIAGREFPVAAASGRPQIQQRETDTLESSNE